MLINNFAEIKNDLLSFHVLTGFRVAIYDLEENELFGFPSKSCGFCQIIKRNYEANTLCIQCDHNAFVKTFNTGKSHLYSCPFGLFEAVVPLLIGDKLVGYLMIGQMAIKSNTSISNIKHLSLPFLKNKVSIIENKDSLPSMSSEQINASLSMLEICASHIIKHGWLKPDMYTLPLKIKEYIDQQYTKDININDICEHTCYSRSYIIKAFKNEYGFSISKYIEHKRLNLAVELLQTSNACISQIAYQCGFNDQYYFSKVFKKAYGCTPTKSRATLYPPLYKYE